MLLAGKNLQSSSDKLVKVTEDYVYHSLLNPNPNLASRIRQLRIVRNLDQKSYSQLKRQLPYLVCGVFAPPYRRTENFAYIDHFIIDIDHLSDKGLDLEQVRNKLQVDSRVMLLFASPGEDGLKVLMTLKEKCYDAGIYSLFYKEFLKSFSFQYGLDQVIDSCTSDVTRACFMSVDPLVYFNPHADPVDMNQYLLLDNPVALSDTKLAQDRREKEDRKKKEEAEPQITKNTPAEPDEETMHAIKERLMGRKLKLKEEKSVYVPQELDDILDNLKVFVEDQGISLYEIVNIQYAKKMRFRLGLKQAEVNLFYGKHGFNVVQSPRSGTSAELNAIVADIIQIYLKENT